MSEIDSVFAIFHTQVIGVTRVDETDSLGLILWNPKHRYVNRVGETDTVSVIINASNPIFIYSEWYMGAEHFKPYDWQVSLTRQTLLP